MLIDTKEYIEAVNIYNQLMSLGSNRYIVSTARLNLTYLMEKQGKADKAVKMFSQISDDSSITVITRCEAEYSAGRIYF